MLVVSRDLLLLLVALLLILTSSKKRFPPSWIGKVTTVTQIVTILFVLCGNLWGWPREVLLIAFGAAATTTILSGFALPGANMHSPNERLLARYVPLGVATARETLVALADLG